MKTRSIKKSEMTENWYKVDVTNVRLGTAAQKIASILLGKSQVNTVPYLNPENKIVVLNADKVDIHPKKVRGKKYSSHSGYPGGLHQRTFEEMMEHDSRKVIRAAVWGMLPKTKMGRAILSNLKVYHGEEFKETAQQPVEIKIK